jgi:hypothetical protein
LRPHREGNVSVMALAVLNGRNSRDDKDLLAAIGRASSFAAVSGRQVPREALFTIGNLKTSSTQRTAALPISGRN